MEQAADYGSVSQCGGMGARHLRSRSRRPALFSKAGSRSDDRRSSPSRCSASRPAQLVTAPPNPTRSCPKRCDLFEYASGIPALSPPYRVKGAPVKVGSHSLRIRPFCSRAERTSQKQVSSRLRWRRMSERSLRCCASRSSHSVFSASRSGRRGRRANGRRHPAMRLWE
jgi:hypothetical protein